MGVGVWDGAAGRGMGWGWGWGYGMGLGWGRAGDASSGSTGSSFIVSVSANRKQLFPFHLLNVLSRLEKQCFTQEPRSQQGSNSNVSHMPLQYCFC